jgi:ATP-dependent helicase HrpB
VQVTRYRDLVVRESRDAAVEPAEAGRVLADALRGRWSELVAQDQNLRTYLARVALLRQAMPEMAWPDELWISEAVDAACAGRRSAEEVVRALAGIVRDRLPYALRRAVETEAPETIQVPSGSRIRLEYSEASPPAAPVLAVRVQEVFGMRETPRVAGGRVAVIVHLLGPNYRPVQVTSDLRSFWANTYPQVRKDLRARYPKHAWPEDPSEARAEARGRRGR